ncbi:MAG: YeeE/YedE family protein, partial [Flavobacteriales bacterium]
GMSSNLRTMCTVAGAGTLAEYFRFDWRTQRWNLVFVLGTVCGGAIARFVLLAPDPVALNPATVASLRAQGITDAGSAFAPAALFGPEAWSNPLAVLTLLLGGLLVGFGTRWANGCTSGHAISGLSSLQWPSLIAVIGFFIGGLTVTHLVLPHLLPIL